MSEPVAWRVYDTDGSEAVFVSDEMAKAAAYEWNWSIEPLYRSPTLTDEEREALAKVLRRTREDFFTQRYDDSVTIAAVVDGLLERTK